MELPLVLGLAEDLLEEHGLDQEGWVIRFYRMDTDAGRCSYGLKEIQLNVRYMLGYSEPQVRQVILHELGHAKAGSVAGHGRDWAKIVREMGGTPSIIVPAPASTDDPLKFFAILTAMIFAGFWFGTLWGVLAILIAVIATIPKVWRAFGPIEDVYKLNGS